MESTHRRIDLQSPADLAYLIANVRSAARQKIDLHLPASAAPAGGEDVLRRRVEELVEAYVRDVFRGARRGVAVNGMALEGEGGEGEDGIGGMGEGQEQEEFEPFDARLADRIRTLEATKESLNEKVADLRRDAPRKAAAKYEKALLKDADAWDRQLAKRREEAVSEARATRLDVGEMRWDEVQAMWERGTDGLVELKGGLTETVARLERAERVVGYLEGR